MKEAQDSLRRSAIKKSDSRRDDRVQEFVNPAEQLKKERKRSTQFNQTGQQKKQKNNEAIAQILQSEEELISAEESLTVVKQAIAEEKKTLDEKFCELVELTRTIADFDVRKYDLKKSYVSCAAAKKKLQSSTVLQEFEESVAAEQQILEALCGVVEAGEYLDIKEGNRDDECVTRLASAMPAIEALLQMCSLDD